ncbi:protein LAZ1 [Tanacetum coccineum]
MEIYGMSQFLLHSSPGMRISSSNSQAFHFLLEDREGTCSGAGRVGFIPSSLGITFSLSYFLLKDVISDKQSERRILWSELGVHKQVNTNIEGHNMFKVVSKRKLLKKPIRKLLQDQGNLHDRVNSLRIELDIVQKALDANPADPILREEECVYVQAFNEAKLDEERFLKQKAKVEWLEVADSNLAYFHKTLKSRNQSGRIWTNLNSENVEVSGNLVPDVFVVHYEQFLGSDVECTKLNVDGLFSKIVPMSIAANMVRNVTNEEIKSAMFDIGDEKAPGPDGFTSVFFKKGWSVVGDDICNAVRDFFSNGQLLKEINHTFLALIPKVATLLRVNGYRPISCCNVIYKCISKILTNQIIEGIKEVVSDNQSAFILGWRISDNILITQELMHTYHKKKGPPRCAFKIDIQKVYDTVDWRFLENILTRLGELLVKYLGVPLISLRLLNRDCKVLVQKATNRIGYWKTSLYLLRDVFNYANCLFEGFYGAMVNLLEVRTNCHGMRFVFLNVKEVLASDVPVKSDMSWGWRKLLQLREVVKPFFWVKLGNGLSTSLWYDRWSDACPLINFLSPRDIHREGFHLNNVVADLIANEAWAWPLSWLNKAPDIGLIATPGLDVGQHDIRQWRDHNGNLSSFSVAKAWEAIRPRGNQVAWCRIVWFSHNIPRHAFHLWLVMRNGLKTHDRMRQWDVGPNGDLNALRCSLCDSQPDSHSRLFFDCVFSSKVWSYVGILADMDLVPPSMHDIMLYLQPMGNKRTARCIFGKLKVAATTYFIWNERNNRTFKKIRRSLEEVRDIIMVTVRSKLLTLRFKNSDLVRLLLSRWKMPMNFRLYG